MTSNPAVASATRLQAPRADAKVLKRTLSVSDVVALTLSGLSPAASVYITGAAILHMAGTGAAAAVLMGGAAVVLASLLYAELGAAFPRAGGVYPGIVGVLGRGAGFVAITLGLVTAPATIAFGTLGLADYLRVLDPSLPKLPIALGTLGAVALLCILNIRANAWLTGAFLVVEIAVLVVLTGAAGLHPARGLGEVLLHPVMAGASHGLVVTPIWTLMLASAAGAFACSGAGLATYFAEDIRGAPQRIGSVVAGVGVVGALVVSIPLVLLTTSAPNLARTLTTEAPIAEYLKAIVGPSAAYATTLIVALAILNNIIASLLAFSRFLYSTGRDGVWPKLLADWMSSLHPRFGSPWLASLSLAAAAGVLCLVGERGLLVVLSGEVFTATLVIVSVLIGRRRGLTGISSFRSPLFPILPIVGFMIVAGFVAADWQDRSAGRPSLFVLATVALVAAGWAALRRHCHNNPRRQVRRRKVP